MICESENITQLKGTKDLVYFYNGAKIKRVHIESKIVDDIFHSNDVTSFFPYTSKTFILAFSNTNSLGYTYYNGNELGELPDDYEDFIPQKAISDILPIFKIDSEKTSFSNVVVSANTSLADSEFPNSSFFTKNGLECSTCHITSICNALGTATGCNCLNYNNNILQNGIGSGIQCFGYADFVYFKTHNRHRANDAQNQTNMTKPENLPVGAWVRSNGGEHSFFVKSKDKYGITIQDANSRGRCKVDSGSYYSYENYSSSVVFDKNNIVFYISPSSCAHSNWSEWYSGKQATCTASGYENKMCSSCGVLEQKVINSLDHLFSLQTCTTPQKCSRCNITTGSALGHAPNVTPSCTAASICVRCNIILTAALVHNYSSPTCTMPSLCSTCNSTKGTPLGHGFSSASCTTASSCHRCGTTSGSPLGHSFSVAATCTTAKKCSRCSSTQGGPLNHNYTGATCTATSKCTRCGSAGSALGHSWVSATCSAPKRCTRCNTTQGSGLGHSYLAATCTTPQKCSRCTSIGGASLGHNLVYLNSRQKRCTRCSFVLTWRALK